MEQGTTVIHLLATLVPVVKEEFRVELLMSLLDRHSTFMWVARAQQQLEATMEEELLVPVVLEAVVQQILGLRLTLRVASLSVVVEVAVTLTAVTLELVTEEIVVMLVLMELPVATLEALLEFRVLVVLLATRVPQLLLVPWDKAAMLTPVGVEEEVVGTMEAVEGLSLVAEEDRTTSAVHAGATLTVPTLARGQL